MSSFRSFRFHVGVLEGVYWCDLVWRNLPGSFGFEQIQLVMCLVFFTSSVPKEPGYMEWIVACPEFPSPAHICTSKAKSEFAVNTPSRPVSDQDRYHWKNFTCPCFLLNLMTSQYVQNLPLKSTSAYNSHQIQPKKHPDSLPGLEPRFAKNFEVPPRDWETKFPYQVDWQDSLRHPPRGVENEPRDPTEDEGTQVFQQRPGTCFFQSYIIALLNS